MTHYLPAFCELRTRQHQRAACGALITWADHSVEPDCPKCQAWIDADTKEAAALAAQWAAEDAARGKAGL